MFLRVCLRSWPSKRGFERRRGSIIVRDSNPKIVKRVIREFELRAEEPTPTYVEIRDRIISEGLVPKDEIKNYYAGNIQRRLQNIFYDGRFTWLGVEYKGLHERIIPQDLFWKVQGTFGLKNPYRKNLNALFGQEWIKCAQCGCSIIYDPKEKNIISTGEKKLYKYYRCSNGKKFHPKLISVSEDSLLEQFSGAIRQISIQEDFRTELMDAVNEAFNKMAQASKDDIDRYKAALESLRAREDRAYDLFDAGDIDKDTYNHQRKRLQEEQRQYTEMMDNAQSMITASGRETVQSIIELATNAESLWNHMSSDERRSLLNKLLSNRSLDGVSVRYEIVKPLRVIAEMKENSKWRICRHLNQIKWLSDTEAFEKPTSLCHAPSRYILSKIFSDLTHDLHIGKDAENFSHAVGFNPCQANITLHRFEVLPPTNLLKLDWRDSVTYELSRKTSPERVKLHGRQARQYKEFSKLLSL